MIVLLDAGHGCDTPGKRSPDGQFCEYAFCRKIAARLLTRLKRSGIDARLLTPEESDIPLAERARRANAVWQQAGRRNVILVSIHVNAAGNGSAWMNARGWEAWTSPGKTASDDLAEALYGAACSLLPAGIPVRTDLSDGDRDKEARFAILMKTSCPAVLTENLFMDNEKDLALLQSEAGEALIEEIHHRGIMRFSADKHL